jgi:PAS domain S-box-containing protein
MTDGFFKAIVSNSSDIISILNSSGDFLFNSNSVSKTLGYTSAEIKGTNIYDYLHPDYKTYVKYVWGKVLSEEQVRSVQAKFLSKDGEWKWMEGTITNMLDNKDVNGIVINARDISEKVYAELLSQESHALYHSLFENHPDAVFSLSSAGNFLSVNSGTLKIFGFPQEEMIDKNFGSFIESSNITIAKTAFTRALAGKSQSGEIKVVNKSGEIKDLLITLYPVKSGGKYEGVHGIAKDNTALKIADKLAKEQTIQLDRTLESITEGFFSLDKNQCFTYINSIGAKTIGKDKEDLLGKNIFTLFPHLCKAAFYTNYIHVTTKKTICRFEDVSPLPGGIFRYNMYRREDGITVFFLDITMQRKAHEDIEKLSLVASKTSSAVLIIDNAGKIEWVNESFSKITGYTQEEVIGKRSSEILCGEDTDSETIKRIRDSFYKEISFSEEILQYHKNGEKIWMTIDATPIFDEDGNLLKYVSIENNITARKLAEQQLILAKEQAEFAAQAKTQFLSVMSHEIRTPMNAVIGFTNLLLSQSPRNDQLEHLKILHFSAENLLVLINDILDFNKIEAGKIEFEQITFDVKELINNVRSSLLQKIAEKKLVIELILDADLPQVTGDPVRVGQVLSNLLSNAVKFTEEGTISVIAAVQSRNNNKVTIDFEVKDTGIGIDPDKHESIFETFTQANSDTTRKFGGTGLGLTITKRILNMLGSEIKLESAPDIGSAFYFSLTFPISELKHVHKPGNITNLYLKDTLSVKVLIAEDNEINILLIKLFLEQWKFDFEVAKNGLEAVEMIQKNNYDVILMDLQMPKMDGYEAAIAIRALHGDRYKNIPIIALTASAMLNIKDKAFDAGMNDYVSKPFNPEELYSKILKSIHFFNQQKLLKKTALSV